MNAAYYLLAICAGLGITLQTTLNGQLAKGVGGDSVAAALFSFTAGAVCLGIFSLMRGGIVASLAASAFVTVDVDSAGLTEVLTRRSTLTDRCGRVGNRDTRKSTSLTRRRS
ncbi:bacterial/archaeal transporter family-2 protein [Burkholderia cepacia]|uniref:DMT family transporter n=1 Tax=Burkholderia cepacia TaxID=292 RepID=UPI0039A42432